MNAYWAMACAALLIAALGSFVLIARDYDARFREAEHRARSLAGALAEHTTQIFVKLDALSHAIIDDVVEPGSDRRTLLDTLRRRAQAEPAATAITVVDRSGHVVASNSLAYAPGMDMTGTVVFAELSAPRAPQFTIDKPYRSKYGPRASWSGWTMNYARRINTPDGKFDGYVLITVDGPFLYGFYDKIELEPQWVIGLVGQDGIIRASNVSAVIGENIKPLIEQEIRNNGGMQIQESIRTGMERLFVYTASSAAPLLAYTGIPTGPIYISFYRFTALVLTGLILLFAALVVIGIILEKYIRTQAKLLTSSVQVAKERQEREFLQSVLNTGGALVVVTNAEGKPVVANSAFHKMFDIASVPDEISLLEYLFGRDINGLRKDIPLEKVLIREDRDGRRREIAWTLNAILDSADEPRNYVAIGFDNTVRREAELAVYQAGKLVTLGEMVTGLAHEINQPLGTIGLTVDVIRSRLKSGNAEPEFIETQLETVSKHVERSAAIIDHMRIFGRKSDGERYPFDPAQAIEGVLTIAGTQLSDAGIRLRKEYQFGSYMVIANLVQVEQVLLNLILNARDAILARRITDAPGRVDEDYIAISISEGEPDGFVAIRVTDTGTGVDPLNIERLFDPFFTTKPIGKGTGLGLSLSYGMIKDLGGEIRARNTNHGAEFTVLLPADNTQRYIP
ncbi:ATP-binding protein [Brucella intermedia]|uniref:ATP-binding protein n=1 Tax=Brucella intermedia TaxID=94625 RepID=UPI0015928BD9|nr:ATP-binding protein [Brucella intermedia]